jgi:hypothetical protein
MATDITSFPKHAGTLFARPGNHGRITPHKRPSVYLFLEAASLPSGESIGKP